MLQIISQTVPIFNGETGDTDVAKEWLNALKAVALMNKWSDTCILESGRSYLDGAAKNWYLSHMSELNSFAKFQKINMWVYGKAQPVISKGETEAIICVDEVKEHVQLVVVHYELQQYNIIIRRSFTELDNVIFIETSDQLIFGYGMKFPYQETDVPGQIANRFVVRIICETEIMPEKSAKVVEVLADNETIEVMIINVGERELRLHRGDHIGVLREQHPSRQSVIVPSTPITTKMVQHDADLNQDEVNELVKLLNYY